MTRKGLEGGPYVPNQLMGKQTKVKLKMKLIVELKENNSTVQLSKYFERKKTKKRKNGASIISSWGSKEENISLDCPSNRRQFRSISLPQ